MKEERIYEIIMREYRCPHCNKLLFKAKLRGQFHIETKCTRPQCGKMIIIDNNSIIARNKIENGNEKNEKL
mgnify:CR=1 FL=1